MHRRGPKWPCIAHLSTRQGSNQLAFGSGEEVKKDFLDVSPGSHLGFPIGTILATFDLQVTSFQGSSQFVFQFKRSRSKINFEDDRNNFSSCKLQVALILSTKYRVSWPFHSRVKVYKSPQYILPSFQSMGLSAQEKKA